MNLIDRIEINEAKNFYNKGYKFKREYAIDSDRDYVSFEISLEHIIGIDYFTIKKALLDTKLSPQKEAVNNYYELEKMKVMKAKDKNGRTRKSAKLTYSILVASDREYNQFISSDIIPSLDLVSTIDRIRIPALFNRDPRDYFTLDQFESIRGPE